MWQQDGSRASWKEEKIRKEAIRLRGFYTILTKGNKFVEKSQDKGKGLLDFLGCYLWEGKYIGDTNDK